MSPCRAFAALVFLMSFSAAVPAAEDRVRLEVAFPALAFERPVDLQDPRDGTGRLAVLEQEGVVRIFRNSPDAAESAVFLDLRAKVGYNESEMGLLGLAFHPDFETNGYFYVNYTAERPLRTVIERYRAAPGSDAADPASATVVLEIPQPYENHNGGQISFGPDGYLYIGTGDGGAGGDPHGNAQNLSSLLGKMLRIDVDSPSEGRPYGIPADNPFAGNSEGWRPEIYAYGLRNPWRFSWDGRGRLWAGDVGQNRYEEIDLVEKGANLGWDLLEGDACYEPPEDCDAEGTAQPVHVYGRDEGMSVTGGFVYRGKRAPSLRGAYVYGDFVTGRVWAIRGAGTDAVKNELVSETGKQIASFGADGEGELYVCAFDGKIYAFTERKKEG